jgi:STE24 endopeptidase
MANEDKSTRYHRLHRAMSILGTALGALFLVALVTSGMSAVLRDWALGAFGSSLLFTTAAYVVAVALLHEIIQLPIAYYRGVTLERRYGLSTQTTIRWWSDHAKAGAIALTLTVGAAILVRALLLWDPERWWIAAAASFALVLVLLAQLAPVVLMPLFYEIKPLEREELARRLTALASRAGARVLGVFEWRLSDRTRKANAALAGLGRTRRILLSDTLLTDYSEDEIEVILAHELSHHVHRDIWSAIALDTALIATGFLAADWLLGVLAGAAGLEGKTDLAGLPLLVLAGAAVSLALMPVANAVSRAHERRADRYALELTANAAAFTSAMKRLGAQNLAEEKPSRLVEVLFYTHPPLAARLQAAKDFARSDSRL